MKERLLHLDIAKAICIIFVVIGHYTPDNMPIWYKSLHDWIYTFHMPLFMFASGYIYIAFKKHESYRKFIWRKVKRLMIPYMTTSIIVITIKLLTQKSMFVENPVTISSYFRMLYTNEAGYFVWFIWSLFTIFCIIPVIKNKYYRLLCFIIALILHYRGSNEFTDIFCLKQTADMLIWFMFGVVIFDWQSLLKLTFSIDEKHLSYVSLSLFILGTGIYIAFPHIAIIKELMPWLGISGIISISYIISKISNTIAIRLITTISTSSYIIYLLHTTFMGFAKSFIYKTFSNNFENNLQFISCACSISLCGIILPILFHKYIVKKHKIISFLFGG